MRPCWLIVTCGTLLQCGLGLGQMQMPNNMQPMPGNLQQIPGNGQQMPGNVQPMSGNMQQMPGNIQQFPSNMPLPAASFTTHGENGESTYTVYNGKVFKVPKKEEPSMWSNLFNFSLTDNALTKTLFGWTEYFTGSSEPQHDPFENNALAAQNNVQYTMPGQPQVGYNPNAIKYGDTKMPLPGQGFQETYPRPPPSQWQQQQQSQPPTFGNSPYGFNSQYPPLPLPPHPNSGNYGQAPPQPQLPVQQAPQFFPQTPQQQLPAPAGMQPLPYSQPMSDYEVGPSYQSVSAPDVYNYSPGDYEDASFKRFYDSSVQPIDHEAVETNEIAEKSVQVGAHEREDEMEAGTDNPCPNIGQWKWDGNLCIALGPYPRWGCKPTDLILTGRVTVCRNRIYFPNDR